MFVELFRAFCIVFIAELGDKTQIVAMTFATQYQVREVLAGVFIGVFINHGLAIMLGQYCSKLIPMGTIQLVAGLMFIIFGMMALREEEPEERGSTGRFGNVFTVALAFFIGELGDKTQLAAMTLSAEGNYPLFILCGTILGMLVTSSLGIYIGSKIGDKIPDISIKIISSIIFILFGIIKIYKWLPMEVLNLANIALYLGIILIAYFVAVRRLMLKRKHSKYSPIKDVATTLYLQTKILKDAVEDICLGEEVCGNCSNNKCIVGYIKKLLKDANEREQYYAEGKEDLDDLEIKSFDSKKVLKGLGLIISYYVSYGVIKNEKFVINQVKDSLEIILFGEKINFDGDLYRYIRQVKRKNYSIGKDLEKHLKKLT